MPTYSYLCGACNGSFEIEQRISEDPLKVCTLCGKSEARRQIVSGNFILKGGGWYSDGYGSSKAKSPAAPATSSDSSSSSSSSSSTTPSPTTTAPAATPSTSTEAPKPATKAASAD